MNLTQRQLQLFTVTADTLNLSRAAERLHLSQPALSRALQALEQQLGVVLFHRSTRQFGLSADGRRFLPHAKRLLDDLRQAVSVLQGRDAELSGGIALCVGTAFGCTVLPEALRSFAMQHPAVRVQLIDANSGAITAAAVAGDVDLGIGSVLGQAPGITAETLLSAPLGLIWNPAVHRLPPRPTPRSAMDWPLIKESEDTSIMQLLRAHGSDWARTMEGGIETSSLALQLSLVQAGVGVSVVSALGASHPQAAGLRFAPFAPAIERHVQVMARRDRPLRPAARRLVEVLKQTLAGGGLPLHRRVRVADQ
ncbi:LysR family transcriptional regulator [Aquabacterium humicola]|uniref:LysR family transcriptional regulator n=1 Tax=Aquabacterium humicola TaxID=3237377 RepID=UPI002543A37F|nr:LysR family transcriptional regulator [Rubrivivax pictus]